MKYGFACTIAFHDRPNDAVALDEVVSGVLAASDSSSGASESTENYRSDVGMEVNAAPLNLSPSVARFPILAVKSTEPSTPATPARPGRSLNTTDVLAWAASGISEVPTVLP
jgi:hypothetical protein